MMNLCEQCRVREATVHLTEVNGGQIRERRLCDPCSYVTGNLAALPDEFHTIIQHRSDGDIAVRVQHVRSGRVAVCIGKPAKQERLAASALQFLQAKLKGESVD